MLTSRSLAWAFRLPASLYRRDLGWLLGRHFLALEHRGRRTGLVRTTVVEVVHRDPVQDEYVVMASFGRTCDWYRNMVAAPPLRVTVGRRSFVPAWRELPPEHGAALLADYESRRWWWGPLLPWLMTKLLGESYRPTPELRRQVAADRPMVAFRPAEGRAG